MVEVLIRYKLIPPIPLAEYAEKYKAYDTLALFLLPYDVRYPIYDHSRRYKCMQLMHFIQYGANPEIKNILYRQLAQMLNLPLFYIMPEGLNVVPTLTNLSAIIVKMDERYRQLEPFAAHIQTRLSEFAPEVKCENRPYFACLAYSRMDPEWDTPEKIASMFLKKICSTKINQPERLWCAMGLAVLLENESIEAKLESLGGTINNIPQEFMRPLRRFDWQRFAKRKAEKELLWMENWLISRGYKLPEPPKVNNEPEDAEPVNVNNEQQLIDDDRSRDDAQTDKKKCIVM